MLSVVALQDINVESKKIPAGKEIATIHTVLDPGTLISIMSQRHLAEVEPRESDLDPCDPYALDFEKFNESLSGDEASELLAILAQRDDITLPNIDGDDDAPVPAADPITDETLLADILDPADFGKNVAEQFAAAEIRTVADLRAYLAIEGNTLSTPKGIGKATAEKMLTLPGLADALGLGETATA